MPAAAAGAIDIGALAVILALLMLLYTIYLANTFAPSFPIIGNVFKDYIGDPLAHGINYIAHLIINFIWNTNVALFYDSIAASTYTGQSVWDEFRYFVMYVWADVGSSVATDIQTFVNWAYNRDIIATFAFVETAVSNIQNQENNLQSLLSGLANRVTSIENTISILPNLAQFATITALDATNTLLSGVGARVTTLENDVTGTIIPDISNLTSDITKVVNLYNGINTKLTSLVTATEPIITSFPLLGKEIGDIVLDIPNIKSDLAKVIGAVAALSGLAVLTVLTAEEVQVLIDLAVDPCMCFNPGGDLEWVKLVALEQLIEEGI